MPVYHITYTYINNCTYIVHVHVHVTIWESLTCYVTLSYTPQVILMWSHTHTTYVGWLRPHYGEAHLRQQQLSSGDSDPVLTTTHDHHTLERKHMSCKITHTCQLTELQLIECRPHGLGIMGSNPAQGSLFELGWMSQAIPFTSPCLESLCTTCHVHVL